MDLFCATPDGLTAILTDDNFLFSFDDIKSGKQILLLKRAPFHEIYGMTRWYSIKAVSNNAVTFILALVRDYGSDKLFLVSYKKEECSSSNQSVDGTAVLIQEHYLNIPVLPDGCRNGNVFLSDDENNEMYCICNLCETNNEIKRTLFHIVKYAVTENGLIQSQSLVQSFAIYEWWFISFIAGGKLYALPLTGNEKLLSFDIIGHRRPLTIDIARDDDDRLPIEYGGTRFEPFIRGELAVYYFFNVTERCGELWTLHCRKPCWKHVLTIAEHPIGKHLRGSLSSHGHLFLYGRCGSQHCVKHKLLHSFDVKMIDGTENSTKFIPTFEQLNALESKCQFKIIHGCEKSGKTTAIILEGHRALEDRMNNLYLFRADSQKTDIRWDYLATLGIVLTDWKTIELVNDSEKNVLLIDGVDPLTFDEKLKLNMFPGKVVITLNQQLELGLQQPKKNVEWFLFYNFTDNKQASFRKGNVVPDNLSERLNEMHLTDFVDSAQFSMDRHYPAWKEAGTENIATVCIPSCLDVYKNRYRGPTEGITVTAITVTDSDVSAKRKRMGTIRGQSGEDIVLNSIRRLNIGGVLIGGFNTEEFLRVMIDCKVDGFPSALMKQWNKSKWHYEADFLFLHPAFGIYIIEVKAREVIVDYDTDDQYQKAAKQLPKICAGILPVFKKITGEEWHIPIHGAICFPFAEMVNVQSENKFDHIDKTLIASEEAFRTFWRRKFDSQIALQTTASFFRFVASVSGYRSAAFLSQAFNALQVHSMLHRQEYMKELRAEMRLDSKELFFLNGEQLAAINCQEKCQLICGPPGTGKTLVILLKAIEAGKQDKNGKVVLMVKNSAELIRKFQRMHAENIENGDRR